MVALVLARAALEAVAYQTRDLFRAMAEDGVKPGTLRVDGGMAANDWLMQFLADLLDITVDRPAMTETTALGAAYLAGLQTGLFSSMDFVAANWRMQARFTPKMVAVKRNQLYEAWQDAVAQVRTVT